MNVADQLAVDAAGVASSIDVRQNLDVPPRIAALIKKDFREKRRVVRAVTPWAYLVCAGAMSRIRRLQLLVWP